MKQKKISLTIGIPMYNHEKTIHSTLDSILCQLEAIKNLCDLEVLISDNCSTDTSPKIVKDYQKKYPKIIKYYKNKTNIGGRYNIKKVFELATKDYIWLFGDDVMLKGAIKSFYKIIQFCLKQKKNLPSIILTDYVHTGKTEISLKEVAKQENQALPAQYFIYDNFYHIKKVRNFSLLKQTFLGMMIFKREELLKILYKIDFENHYPHFMAYLELAKSQTVALIDKVLLYARLGTWAKRESSEFCILATMSYLFIIKNIYGDYLLSKEDIQESKKYILTHIKRYYRTIKNPKSIVDAFKQIAFFNKLLLITIKFLSYFQMNRLAFTILVIYAKIYINIAAIKK